MTSTEFLAAFGEMVMQPEPLEGSEKLDDLVGWDSVAMMSLIAMADDNGVKVSPRQIAVAETVADLMALVKVQG